MDIGDQMSSAPFALLIALVEVGFSDRGRGDSVKLLQERYFEHRKALDRGDPNTMNKYFDRFVKRLDELVEQIPDDA